ncbi:transcriptional regulator [Listeria welshimeri]|uniref:ATP-binding protein n=1 Tax=Listeria welshimeri TaxID=1643 RepID=UPI0017FBA73E|nr:ATP-binding protein [Listeria welshimeri]MBC1289268.1 transcriptional regulator [Listeria welshimeri]MBC1446651.1 transcriptional regulator [Listeria welshimeri]MBC1652842.1 transcriptional regulator [Listeria welshimeri]MBC1689313.1 transcriptional regulator [Listeria welshimeri]MBC1692250.1 transcriptional regulator [Listeria welshimeri]
MKTNYLENIIRQKISSQDEDNVTEFKVDNTNPEFIGEYISALSNSAALKNVSQAFLIWGVEDGTKEIVGTNFYPASVKKGNEELESWLAHSLSPRVSFEFHEIELEGKRVVTLLIDKAAYQPIKFKGEEYIRIGSYKKKLKDYPEKEKRLWSMFSNNPFEYQVAKVINNKEEIFSLLDYESYYRLLGQTVPENKNLIIENFISDKLVKNEGNWEITNLGAILFANQLVDFEKLSRKATRVIIYKGKGKTAPQHEQLGCKGYASGFEGLIQYVNNQLPVNEVIGVALRKNVRMYPELAVRELIVNALIHQDFAITGTGPTIEIFENRMEITNPGIPLIQVDRFLDSPPRSRNEVLASLMRRMGICEERGSGIDKVVAGTEEYQLPAPLIRLYEEHLKVTLFAHKSLNDMTSEEKVQATYMHACLKYVEQDALSNQTLRERFGLSDAKNSVASRIIKEAVVDGKIKAIDPNTSTRYMKYIPHWA